MARDMYQEVTDRIVAALENGVAPWVRPWATAETGNAADTNAVSGKPYRGVNVLVLWCARAAFGYRDSRWLTFKQALDLGGNVRKGEKGTQIVFWKINGYETENDAGETETRSAVLARAYTVFNVEQCDGLQLDASEPTAPAIEPSERVKAAIAYAAATGADIRHGGNSACYMPGVDAIRVPELGAFKSDSHYAATLLHELTHWTGAKERCDRTFGKRFGDDAYAVEELVAELGAAFACAELGIAGQLQHENYLGHWLRVLKADKRALFTAASQARKAVEFMNAKQPAQAGEESAAA